MNDTQRYFHIVCFAALSSGCHATIRPPDPATIDDYCLESAEEANARAVRARRIAIGSGATAGLILGATPLVSSIQRGERGRVLVGTSMTAAAVAMFAVASQWQRASTHENAIASGFTSCIGADPQRAFSTARAIYQLWVRPDTSRAELIRQIAAPIGPMTMPPPPPPWADEPGEEPSRRNDVVEVRMEKLVDISGD